VREACLMANVTGTDKFFDDPRFDTAGVLLGVDGDLVRARMMRLWSWQTDNYTDLRPTYVVTRVELVGKLKDARAPEVLVECGLVEPRDGGFYVCGTEGEIEWLWKKKLAGARGGEVRARAARDAGRASGGRFRTATQPSTSQAPTKHKPSTAPGDDQTPTTPRDPESGISDLSLAGAREATGMGHLVAHAVDRLNAARSEIDPNAPTLGVFGDDAGARKLLDHLRKLPEADRRRRLDHGLDVLIATVRAKGWPVGELRLGQLAGDASWSQWQAGTVASVQRAATRGRDGPAGPRTGQARPAASHGTDLIDPRSL
jgi:hypothetical protein